MSIFNKSTVAATAKAKATPAGSIPTADCQKACRQLETWGVEQNETEIRRYLAGQAALKGGSRLSKKEFLKTHLEDEYSESLSRKLWVVPRRQKKVDAFVADLEDGAVVSPGLLFKPPSGIDLGAYWFIDASVPIEKLGFGVMEHYTTVKAKATTSETGGSGGPPALTAGAGSSGDTVPHPLFDALAHDASAPPPAAKKPRKLAKVWSDEAKGANIKDVLEDFTDKTLDAADAGLWYNPDPAVQDNVHFWLTVFSRHLDKVHATWLSKQTAPNDTPKVAW